MVLGVDRGKVRVGFSAPRDVPIFREECLPPSGSPPASVDYRTD